MKCCDFPKMANDKITVRSQTLSDDGYGGQFATWATVGTYWAWIKPLNVYEAFQQSQLQSTATHKMIIRYNSTFADTKDFAAYSITFDSRIYSIVGIKNFDNTLKNYGSEYQEIMVVDNGPEHVDDISFPIITSGVLSGYVTFTRASTATYFDSAGVMQTAAVDTARLDYLQDGSGLFGLRVEGARTNSIPNSTMVGAGVGTLPTGWAKSAQTTGLSVDVLGTGTENGMQYIDAQISGMATGTAACLLQPYTVANIAASAGQAWAASWYVKLIAGSLTDVGSARVAIPEFNSGGTFLTQSSTSFLADLDSSLFRAEHTRTLTDATTTVTSSYIFWDFTSGAVVDFTIRIYNPQLELGSYTTSYIPTTTAAATRAADIATIDLSKVAWFNATEGSLYSDSVPVSYSQVGDAARVWELSDGTATNRTGVYRDNALSYMISSSAGTDYTNASAGAWSSDTESKIALGYKVNDFAVSADGAAVVTDTTVTLPIGITTLYIGSDSSSNAFYGIISDLTYYPTRKTDAQLVTLTT